MKKSTFIYFISLSTSVITFFYLQNVTLEKYLHNSGTLLLLILIFYFAYKTITGMMNDS
jgi:hypothetical protein